MGGSKHFFLVMLALLAACAQPQGSGPGGGNPGGGNPGGGNPGGGPCATVVHGDVTVPTQAVNGSSACDYLVDGFIKLESTLIVEPGTVIRFTKDSSLWVEGGELVAVGNPNARITLEDQSPIQGFWNGITLSSQAGRVDLQYVDLKDAGQTCTIPYCSQGALRGYGGGQLTLKHSTISNSYVHGAILDESLVEFANNHFYGNRWNGLVIDAAKVPLLDGASDYAGGDKPNGDPGVRLSGGTSVSTATTWKKLNAPYFLGSYVKVEATLTLQPGVRFVADGGWLSIEPGGTLLAVGTASEPIVFTGVTETPGAWDGIYFAVYNRGRDNRLEYVHMAYGGGGPRELITNGLITGCPFF
ncbi:MAG: hypothetical protein N2318_01435 [Meiothermus sp.]|nr:hypothetical protein [Meiothermus sp.]